jgi:hypothetical protein
MGGKLFLIPKIAWLENIKPEFNHFGHATDFRRTILKPGRRMVVTGNGTKSTLP